MRQSASNVIEIVGLYVADRSLLRAVPEELAESFSAIGPAAPPEIAASDARIEQAKGMLMFVYGINAHNAFEILKWWSQATNVTVQLLAAQLIAELLALTSTERLDKRTACDDVLFRVRHGEHPTT